MEILGSRWVSTTRSKKEKECRLKKRIKVDDVVILADPNFVREKWNFGRITEVYPGKDGRLRNVQAKTLNGLYPRPVTMIAVIDPVEDYT